MTSRIINLSENVFAIVQNHLVFSILKLNGGSKKTNFESNLANLKSYDESLYEVLIGNQFVSIGFDLE